MSDIRTALHDAAFSSFSDTTTSEAAAEADLFRGRRALRRRRANRMRAGSGLVAAAAVGAFMLVGPGVAVPGSSDVTTAAPGTSTSSVKLVSYKGTQPTGYTLDKVPSGWAVRDDTQSLLTLAPVGAKAPVEEEGSTSLEGTIAVMTQADTGVPTGVQLDDVTVGGKAAVIAHMKGAGDTRTLFLQQASGGYLVIQVWGGLGWDNNEIASFASSVHVTKTAEPGVG